MVERLNGIQEVRSSTLLTSTQCKGLDRGSSCLPATLRGAVSERWILCNSCTESRGGSAVVTYPQLNSQLSLARQIWSSPRRLNRFHGPPTLQTFAGPKKSAAKCKTRRKRGERYNPQSYGLAIDRACDRAFRLPGHLVPAKRETREQWWTRLSAEEQAEVRAWRKLHRWHPNQLRHSYATLVQKEHGLEAVQVLLGHSRADVTQIYAEKNLGLAVGIALKIG